MSGRSDAEAILAADKTATPGPWTLVPNPEYVIAGNIEDGPTVAQVRRESYVDGTTLPQSENAAFIALARTAAPALARHALALADALRAIAEGGLGDEPWFANYDRIREFAREALRQYEEEA